LTDPGFRWNSPQLLAARDVSADAATARRDQHVAASELWLAEQRAVVRAPQRSSRFAGTSHAPTISLPSHVTASRGA
jgi:hypothetical protein